VRPLGDPLVLKSVSTATTYNFRDQDGWGWACCTVNDKTGELAITSDWGNYAHRWNIDHLGNNGRTTLTSFIGGGQIDYLADKLTSREQRERFDADATVAEFRELLRERRREVKHYGFRDRRPGVPDPTLDKETSRRLWDAIQEIANDAEGSPVAGDRFVDRYFGDDRMGGAAEYVTDEPWNLIRTKPSGEYLALTKLILPALVDACRAAVASVAAITQEGPNPS